VEKTTHDVLKPGSRVFLILILIGLVISALPVSSQAVKSTPSRQAAMDAFTSGMYDKALGEFTELLKIYTRDPLYRYYSGVCLVKLERDPLNAVELLQHSYQGSGLARSVPQDVLFWLARAQHQAGQFAAAANNYGQFSAKAGRRTAREYNVAEYIRQCNERRGELTVLTMEQKIRQAVPDEAPVPVAAPAATATATANKPVTATKSDPKPEKLPSGYDRVLREALDYQVRADSLQNLAAAGKKQLAGKSAAQRALSEREIADLEQLSAYWQRMADQRYNEARAMVNEKSPGEEPVKTQPARQPVAVPDKTTPVTKPEPEPVRPAVQSNAPEQAELFSIFEVVTKPTYGPGDNITLNPDIPAGLIYRIQLAVFRNPVAPSVFKGITPLYGFTRSGTDLTIYYAGMFRRAADATRAVTTVRQMGFRDAFVVALLDGRAVSAERAAILEKEWGNVSLVPAAVEPADSPENSEPPTLSFRVEAVRSAKPLKDDMVETIRVIAGSRGLDIYATEDDKIAYLIGKFITFESASEYAGLLVRNGYREARVVAWLGTREIDLDVARQLFERPE